jgi:hypothetical protein
MSQQLTTRYVEAGYRRGYQQCLATALDAIFIHRLDEETLRAWEQQIADWRNSINQEDYGYQQPPSPFGAIGQAEEQAA